MPKMFSGKKKFMSRHSLLLLRYRSVELPFSLDDLFRQNEEIASLLARISTATNWNASVRFTILRTGERASSQLIFPSIVFGIISSSHCVLLPLFPLFYNSWHEIRDKVGNFWMENQIQTDTADRPGTARDTKLLTNELNWTIEKFIFRETISESHWRFYPHNEMKILIIRFIWTALHNSFSLVSPFGTEDYARFSISFSSILQFVKIALSAISSTLQE